MPVLICNASDFCKIAAAKRLHVAKDLPGVPIPPFEVKQVRDQLIVKPPPDHAARIPARDAVWRNILCDDGIRADDRAVANVYARHHGHILADPDVVADRDGTGVLQPLIAPFRVKRMTSRIEPAVRRDKNVVAKGHLCTVKDNRIVVGKEVFTDGNIAAVIASELCKDRKTLANRAE